jgi:hypothetical protein
VADMKKKRDDAPQATPASVKKTHKRKKGARSGPDADDTEGESRPTKRQRGRIQVREVFTRSVSPEKFDVIKTKAATSTQSTKRYGKKGRTTSPAPSGINYDELPSSSVPYKAEKSILVPQRLPVKEVARKASNMPTRTGKTRASAMRRKVEKLEKPPVTKIKADEKAAKALKKRTSNVDHVQMTDIMNLDQPETERVTRSKLKLDKVCFIFANFLDTDPTHSRGRNSRIISAVAPSTMRTLYMFQLQKLLYILLRLTIRNPLPTCSHLMITCSSRKRIGGPGKLQILRILPLNPLSPRLRQSTANPHNLMKTKSPRILLWLIPILTL